MKTGERLCHFSYVWVYGLKVCVLIVLALRKYLKILTNKTTGALTLTPEVKGIA